jgi:single-strand DNA-binding protein
MINKVILIGNLGKDPEVRYTQSGTAVASFSIATSERKKGQDGKYETTTEWHSIVAWDKLAEICKEYLHKGMTVYIEGKLQTRKWQDKDGHDRLTTEIVARDMKMMGKKEGGNGSNDQGGYAPQGGGTGNQYSCGDQVPF